MKRRGRIYPDCPSCGTWLEFKLAHRQTKRVTLTCTCGFVFGGWIRNLVGGITWRGRHFKRLREIREFRKKAQA